MIISLLVAMDQERGIGKDNQLPWHLSSDLKRFKALTMRHFIIMGRKTFETIGRPLPGRKSIVVTHNLEYQPEEIKQTAGPIFDQTSAPLYLAHALIGALHIAETNDEDEVFIIGGGEIFTEALPLASKIYLTNVLARLECDTFFPEFDDSQWEIIEELSVPADEHNQFDTIYQVLVRK